MGYFEDQIAQGKPIVPPPPPPVQLEASTQVSVTNDFPGLPVRASGDRVFLLKDGKKFWITNPEAMTKLGFKLGEEAKIDQQTLDVLAEGEPLR